MSSGVKDIEKESSTSKSTAATIVAIIGNLARRIRRSGFSSR